MAKRKKLEKVDGLGPFEKQKIRNAVRQVWHRSYARKLVVNRCTKKDGYTYCELCKRRCPKLKIDHINKVGEVDAGFVLRMFVPSNKLQGMCDKCHNAKTKEERRAAAAQRKAEKVANTIKDRDGYISTIHSKKTIKDFY